MADQTMEGYLRLLEAIAENRCSQYRKAYRLYLEDPRNVGRQGKLAQLEQKLRSAPTNYGDNVIKILQEQVESETWNIKIPRYHRAPKYPD